MTITRVQVVTDGRLSSGSATYQGMTTDEVAAHAEAKLAQAEQAAHLTGWHQTPATQIDGQHLVDIHGRDHEGRS